MIIIKVEELLTIELCQIPEVASHLRCDDVEKLVEWLSSKDNDLRYKAFLLLQEKSRMDSQVYPYWNLLQLKLKSDNSYQRSIGVMLIAENVQWDTTGRMQNTLYDYLTVLQDPKPVTIRQCIQSMKIIVNKQPKYAPIIAEALLQYDIMSVRKSMQKLILMDIIYTLIEVQRNHKNEEISLFIAAAFSSEILDEKSKKSIMKLITAKL